MFHVKQNGETGLTEAIRSGFQFFQIMPTADMLNQLVGLAELILEYNRTLNLVAKTDPASEVVRQILDSAMPVKFEEQGLSGRLLDVGSGAGFPGMVLKILRPQIKLISLDSSSGKIAFQELAASRLGLTGCEFRAAQFQEYRSADEIDIITVKAVGGFSRLLRFAGHALRPGGAIIFYLGANIPGALAGYGRDVFNNERCHIYQLPDKKQIRRLFIIAKRE